MTNFRDSRRTDPTRMSPGDERGPQGSAAAVEGGKEGGEVVGVGGQKLNWRGEWVLLDLQRQQLQVFHGVAAMDETEDEE